MDEIQAYFAELNGILSRLQEIDQDLTEVQENLKNFTEAINDANA